MPLESSIVGTAGAPIVSEIDSRWTMAYAAALGDAALLCYMDTTRPVIAHPMFPVCFEWPVQVAMRAQFEKSTSLTRDEAMRGVQAVSRIVESEGGKDPERIERIAGRFGAMVMMPSTLMVRVLAREGAAVFFEVLSGQGRLAVRDGIVMLHA